MKALTEKQRDFLDFYLALTTRSGRVPTITEVSESYGKSMSTVYETLKSLEMKGFLESVNGDFVLPEDVRRDNEPIDIPLYRNACDIEGETLECITLPRNLGVSEESFAIVNHSDEMSGEGIVPGDTLVFHMTDSAENDQIVLASILGENEQKIQVLRRYRERNERIELIPENDSIGIITTHECRILGILEVKLRKYKA